MELQGEEDDGWAGHQEEVDYSKEVVFEDSSDEDGSSSAHKRKPPQQQVCYSDIIKLARWRCESYNSSVHQYFENETFTSQSFELLPIITCI